MTRSTSLHLSTMSNGSQNRDRGWGAARLARHLSREPAGACGLVIVVAFVIAPVCAPLLATHNPVDHDLSQVFAGPSRDHLLGTDNLGRDIYSRLLFGSRLSLGTAIIAGITVMTVGVAVGLLSGLRGGWIDGLTMRVVDGVLAFPNLILALAIAGVLGGGLLSVILGLTAVWWASYARLVRGFGTPTARATIYCSSPRFWYV